MSRIENGRKKRNFATLAFIALAAGGVCLYLADLSTENVKVDGGTGHPPPAKMKLSSTSPLVPDQSRESQSASAESRGENEADSKTFEGHYLNDDWTLQNEAADSLKLSTVQKNALNNLFTDVRQRLMDREAEHLSIDFRDEKEIRMTIAEYDGSAIRNQLIDGIKALLGNDHAVAAKLLTDLAVAKGSYEHAFFGGGRVDMAVTFRDVNGRRLYTVDRGVTATELFTAFGPPGEEIQADHLEFGEIPARYLHLLELEKKQGP